MKLDIGLIRGLDGDPGRQALLAGMAYFAVKRRVSSSRRGSRPARSSRSCDRSAVPYGQGYLLGRPQDGRGPGRGQRRPRPGHSRRLAWPDAGSVRTRCTCGDAPPEALRLDWPPGPRASVERYIVVDPEQVLGVVATLHVEPGGEASRRRRWRVPWPGRRRRRGPGNSRTRRSSRRGHALDGPATQATRAASSSGSPQKP